MTTIQQIEIVGLIAAVAALWEQLAAMLRWPRRWLVISRVLEHDGARALVSYLHDTARWRPSDGSRYSANHAHIKPIGRIGLVWAEQLHEADQTFWLRGRPVWYRYVGTRDGYGASMSVYFLRWSLDWDAMLRDVATWEDMRLQSRGGVRFRCHVHGGSSVVDGASQETPPPPISVATDLTAHGYRLLHWRPEHLGCSSPMALQMMSLRPEQVDLAADISRFLRSREWCEEHGIPWRRGWLIHGNPGTGKTSFVRGIAVEHDIPVHVFDLGSMGNNDLRTAWTEMLRDVPCAALIEDIDAVYGIEGDQGVFDARAPRGQAPTFDALLQCIGGISTCDGVLLFVTTNHPERIDHALRRGGRVDMEIEFLAMDREGRIKMASRILGERDGAAAADDRTLTHSDGVEISPADFQERLCRRALAERFGDPQ